MSDDELRQILSKGFTAMADAKGVCPSRDELVRYHAGELPEARAAEVAQHAVRCPDCDLLLDQMERFDAAICDEAGARGVVVAFSPGPTENPRVGWIGYWRPVLGGAIAACVLLVFPMYWLLRPATSPQAPRLENGTPNLATLCEVIVIPQSRQAAEGASVRLLTGDTSIVVSFFVPMAAGRHYKAVILSASNEQLFEPIDISSEVETGNVGLTFRALLLRVLIRLW